MEKKQRMRRTLNTITHYWSENCPRCKKRIMTSYNFCPHCGQAIERVE